jgi:hypothetical protein
LQKVSRSCLYFLRLYRQFRAEHNAHSDRHPPGKMKPRQPKRQLQVFLAVSGQAPEGDSLEAILNDSYIRVRIVGDYCRRR